MIAGDSRNIFRNRKYLLKIMNDFELVNGDFKMINC